MMTLNYDVLHFLKSKKYTVLVAENQDDKGWYTFTPQKWDVDVYLNETVLCSFGDHVILIIDEALKLHIEDLMNHQVKFE